MLSSSQMKNAFYQVLNWTWLLKFKSSIEAVCISHSANTPGKGKNLTILPLCVNSWQPVYEKNSKFKPDLKRDCPRYVTWVATHD